MRVIILGSGVIGVTTAYYLNKLGYDVTVIDRQAQAAAETSFANGGQISVSHAEPWANPGAPWKTLKWLLKDDAPLLFRPRADWHQWLWGLSFLYECTPWRTRHNIRQIVQLGTYSREMLQSLRIETGLQYSQRRQGILHFYTSRREFNAAVAPTKQMQDLGCDRRLISADEAVILEPALSHIRPQLAGATYTGTDESGDAQQFTRGLAALCAERGVTFLMNHNITALRTDAGQVHYVEATDADGRYVRLVADAYVLSLGSFSPLFARQLGIHLNIYPAKGYSVTMPILNESMAHQVSLTDDEYKLVFSRLGDRLRIAGTAELNGYDRNLDPVRCEAIVRRVEELFPGAGDTSKAQFWTGLRPATPSNIPYIGRSKIQNLYLNTGHGTLGWTHACGSASSIADIISGRKPKLDFAFTEVRAGSFIRNA